MKIIKIKNGEEYKTFTTDSEKTADLLLNKPSYLHILYVKDIDKLKDFANIWQCPECKEYFSYETLHTSQKSHIKKCKGKHHIMKLNNVRQLYKEMNKRRGYNYNTIDYPNGCYELFIGYEHLLTEDMDDIINISPYFGSMSPGKSTTLRPTVKTKFLHNLSMFIALVDN